MRNTRLAGHELPWEGRLDPFNTPAANAPGKTRCTCGQWSPELPSTRARRKWHADHKNDIRSERGLARTDTKGN